MKRELEPKDYNLLANEAAKFTSSIVIKFDNISVDVKSVMGLFVSLTGNHDHYVLQVIGRDKDDEDKAKKHIMALLQSFGLNVKVEEN